MYDLVYWFFLLALTPLALDLGIKLIDAALIAGRQKSDGSW